MNRRLIFLLSLLLLVAGTATSYLVWQPRPQADETPPADPALSKGGMGEWFGESEADVKAEADEAGKPYAPAASVTITPLSEETVFQPGDTLSFAIKITAPHLAGYLTNGEWLEKPTTRRVCKDEAYFYGLYFGQGHHLYLRPLKAGESPYKLDGTRRVDIVDHKKPEPVNGIFRTYSADLHELTAEERAALTRAISDSCYSAPNADGTYKISVPARVGAWGTTDSTGATGVTIRCVTRYQDPYTACSDQKPGWRWPDGDSGGDDDGDVLTTDIVAYNSTIIEDQTTVPLAAVDRYIPGYEDQVFDETTELTGTFTYQFPSDLGAQEAYRVQILVQPPAQNHWVGLDENGRVTAQSKLIKGATQWFPYYSEVFEIVPDSTIPDGQLQVEYTPETAGSLPESVDGWATDE